MIPFAFLLLLAMSSKVMAATESRFCGPRAEIRAELAEVLTLPISDPSAFDRNIAQWQALRERYPNDLFVHESYQDAVQRLGVEGHLRVLTDEYQTLSSEHPGEIVYRYLFARSLIGRGTYPAIQEMNEIVATNPEFAPAHRMLAGIYATEVFGDVPKANAESERFLRLCPGTEVSEYPSRLPGSSPLIDRAEQLLAGSGDPDRVAELAERGLKDDEWRLQHIRPFDWYSVEFKIENQRRLQTEYWQVWGIQVRCYRRAGKAEKAAKLLATMDQRALQLRTQPGNAYWDALVLLARLYGEGSQRDRAEEKIAALRKVISEHPDSSRAKEIEKLQGISAAQTAVKARP